MQFQVSINLARVVIAFYWGRITHRRRRHRQALDFTAPSFPMSNSELGNYLFRRDPQISPHLGLHSPLHSYGNAGWHGGGVGSSTTIW